MRLGSNCSNLITPLLERQHQPRGDLIKLCRYRPAVGVNPQGPADEGAHHRRLGKLGRRDFLEHLL